MNPPQSIHAGSATMARELVLDLAAVDASMLPLVGGKAANLGEMIQAGLPVPPGVCVTTEAYKQVAAAAAIDFDALARAGPQDVEGLARRAREALIAAPIPAALARAIVAGYSRLGVDVPVAVRSSATAEDLAYASFAGQQDTYLHIIGAEAVVDAVRRCWASLWSDRAVVYRNTNGLDHRTVQLAVAVQRMVDAEVAGVLFTANPVTGRRRQSVIDASPGLGEAVVSGAVNPDHFVVDTGTGEIVERRLGDKRFEVRSLAGGGTEHVERPGSADRACLTDAQVRALVALGDQVEAHYFAPQDTEWAIDRSGKLWLTQARPITTLFPLPAGRKAAGAASLLLFQRRPGTVPAADTDGAGRFSGDRFSRRPADGHSRGRSAIGSTGLRGGRPARVRGPYRSTPWARRAGTHAARSRLHGGALGRHSAPFVRRPAAFGDAAISAAVRAPGSDHRHAVRSSAAGPASPNASGGGPRAGRAGRRGPRPPADAVRRRAGPRAARLRRARSDGRSGPLDPRADAGCRRRSRNARFRRQAAGR